MMEPNQEPFDAEQYAERAQRYFHMGKWELAVDELRKALDIDPEQAPWHLGMALALDALGEFEEAKESYEIVLEMEPHQPVALLHLARLLINSADSKSLQEAIEHLETLSRVDQTCEPSYCYRILAYGLLGDLEQAELMFYMSQQIDETCPFCFDHLAQALLREGNNERAKACWRRSLELDASATESALKLARLHVFEGDQDTARIYYRKFLRQYPGHVRALVETGQLLIELGQYEEANEKLRRALEQDADHAEAHLLMGELFLLNKKWERSRSHLEHAQNINPTLSGLHLRLAQLAVKQNRIEQAIRLAEIEMKQPGRDALTSLDLGLMLLTIHQPQLAIKPLKDALYKSKHASVPIKRLFSPTEQFKKISPHRLVMAGSELSLEAKFEAHCLLSQAYLQTKSRQQAYQEARKAIRKGPRQPSSWMLIARACLAQNQFYRATAAAKKALQLADNAILPQASTSDRALGDIVETLAWRESKELRRLHKHAYFKLLKRRFFKQKH